jgi:membrane associated rhomboid family serine protease
VAPGAAALVGRPAVDRPSVAVGGGADAVIPMADENPVRHFPWCTLMLILTCTIVYFAVQPGRDIKLSWTGIESQRINANDLRFVTDNAGIPCELVRGRPLTEDEFQRTNNSNTDACTHGSGPSHSPGKNVYLAAVLTMFLHGSITHLFGNMLFLWVFGNNIEDRRGWWRFLLLYLVGGAVATASQVAIDPSSTVPIIGASGAIAAVMGAYLVSYPKARIKSIIFLGPVLLRKVTAAWLLILWFLTQFLYVFNNAGIAWGAHVGGFLFGVLVGCYWRLRERARRVDASPALAPSTA